MNERKTLVWQSFLDHGYLKILPRKPGTYAFIDSRHLVDCRDGMRRTARASVGSMWYRSLNRGNRREAVFHKPGDYDAFVEVMIDARARLPVG
jgi:hypothetical protein